MGVMMCVFVTICSYYISFSPSREAVRRVPVRVRVAIGSNGVTDGVFSSVDCGGFGRAVRCLRFLLVAPLSVITL